MRNGKKLKRVVAAIYIDPDFYPPTINGILNMAPDTEELIVVSRNNSHENFPFPGNVKLLKKGPVMTVRASEQMSTFLKVKSFFSFVYTLLSVTRGRKADIIVLYDPFPLLAWYLVRPLISSKTLVWYHNHDMPSIQHMRKYSIGWFAGTREKKAMSHIDVFTLPSSDRLQFYPWLKKSIPYATIPNYPSLKHYTGYSTKDLTGDIRVIYQGFVGPGHGIEELVQLLPETISGKRLHLVLKGSVTETYKRKIEELAIELSVSGRITWVGISAYAALRGLTDSCHIGIGIHMNTDQVSKTLGTASNKIYEYAACGLPVILYDSEQFTRYLKQYKWTFFTDGSVSGIRACLVEMIPKLNELAPIARRDFEQGLNFETAFTDVWNDIKLQYERKGV